jgi:hypothetical protein
MFGGEVRRDLGELVLEPGLAFATFFGGGL